MNQRKKVVFATNNLGIGGGETMLVEQVKHLNHAYFEPYIITILPNPKIDITSKIPSDVIYRQFNFSSLIDVISFYNLWTYLRNEKIDAVVTSLFDTNLIVRLAAILARVPVILSYEHNIYQHKKRWQIWVDKILARYTKKILVGSNEVLEFTSKQENLPKEKFQLNFNSIPLKFGDVKKNRNQVLGKLGLRDELTYIATAGSLTEQKGHVHLIDAVYQMKQRGLTNFKVLLFGKGILQNALSDQIQRLGLIEEVKLMGFAPSEEIMAISDIFTLPSLWEGLSLALLEAMDAGCPIVATKVSGTNEALIDQESALLVEPGNSAELSAALQKFINEPSFGQRLALKAKEDVKKFSIEKNVKVIENLIIET